MSGNTNVTKIIPAKTMVTQKWFLEAVNSCDPIDVFVLIGHNPIRNSSFRTVFDAIRAVHPNTPIQILGLCLGRLLCCAGYVLTSAVGGHTHIRDFTVYDESSVAIESGKSGSRGSSVSHEMMSC